MGERIRVSKTQIDVGLRRKVEDGINFVSLQTVHHFRGIGDVAMVEGKVALVVESSSVVQGGAVIELVERHDVVCIGIGQSQMSDQPASTAAIREVSCGFGA